MQPSLQEASSSEDEAAARCSVAAISAEALQQDIVDGRKLAKQREARARQRRAGGGGILGAVTTGTAGCEDESEASVFLDAAQIKVADILQRRLAAELVEAPATAPPGQPQQEAHDDGDGGAGVRLFRQVKPGTPMVDRQQQQQQGTEQEQQDYRPRRVTELGHLEPPTKVRCKAAAVDGADIVQAAEAAAAQTTQHIASPTGWLPADNEPSRWSHRRKRRAAKLEAESAAWRQKQQQAGQA